MMHVGDTLSIVGDIMHTSRGTMMHVGGYHECIGGYYGYIFGFSAYWGFQYKGDACFGYKNLRFLFIFFLFMES